MPKNRLEGIIMDTANTMNSGKKESLYLVTSAAGFMGGQVVRQLLTRGERVRAFVLRGDPGVKYVPKEACKFRDGKSICTGK